MKKDDLDIFRYLVANKRFKDSVLDPFDDHKILHEWMDRHPESIADILRAKEFIERITFNTEQLTPAEMKHLLEKIMDHPGSGSD